MDYTFLDKIYQTDTELYNELMNEIFYDIMFKRIWRQPI